MENFAPVDLYAEQQATLRAIRITGTLAILFAAAHCWHSYGIARQMPEIMENMVQGGVSQLPDMTRFVVENVTSLIGGAALAASASLLLLWVFAVRVSTALYCVAGGISGCLIVAEILEFSYTAPLITVITKFNG